MLLRQQPSGCVTWRMNAFVYMETEKEFFRTSRLLKRPHTLRCFRGRSDTQYGFSLDTMLEETHE